MAFKVFQDGTSLTAEDLNDVIVEQAVITFADAAARDNAIPSPNVGQHCFLVSTGETYKYVNGGWVVLLGDKVSGLQARQTVTCTSTTRPGHAVGRIIYETDTKFVLVSDGTNWARAGGGKPIARVQLIGSADSAYASGAGDILLSSRMEVFNNNVATLDPYGMWDNTNKRFILPFTGWYRSTLQVACTGPVGTQVVIRIMNNTTITTASNSAISNIVSATEHHMEVNSYIAYTGIGSTVYAGMWSNGAVTIKNNVNGPTNWTLEYVGPI